MISGDVTGESVSSPAVSLTHLTDVTLRLEVFGLQVSSGKGKCRPGGVAKETEHLSFSYSL